jgi:hypothetical protein
MLHHAKACKWQVRLQLTQRLAVLPEELIEQQAPARVSQGFEDSIHARIIRDSLVTHQAYKPSKQLLIDATATPCYDEGGLVKQATIAWA